MLLDGEDQEDVKGFRRLLRRFQDDLAPANAIEEVLVERLVISYWRLGRVVLAEKGAVERQFDALELGRDERTCERAEELMVGEVENPVDRLRDLPGVDSLLDALAHARQQVEERGYLMPDELEVFGALFGYTSAVLEQPAKMPGTEAEERKAQALAFLGGIEEDLQNRRARLLEHAQRELEHERMRLAVPDEATANRLVRYEAHLDRTFFRTLHELERLQAMRRGELVAPRIHVDLDVAGRRD